MGWKEGKSRGVDITNFKNEIPVSFYFNFFET